MQHTFLTPAVCLNAQGAGVCLARSGFLLGNNLWVIKCEMTTKSLVEWDKFLADQDDTKSETKQVDTAEQRLLHGCSRESLHEAQAHVDSIKVLGDASKPKPNHTKSEKSSKQGGTQQ